MFSQGSLRLKLVCRRSQINWQLRDHFRLPEEGLSGLFLGLFILISVRTLPLGSDIDAWEELQTLVSRNQASQIYN